MRSSALGPEINVAGDRVYLAPEASAAAPPSDGGQLNTVPANLSPVRTPTAQAAARRPAESASTASATLSAVFSPNGLWRTSLGT